MKNEFQHFYKEQVVPALQKQHGYKNVHQIPKVEKVVVNTSVGSQSDVKQALDEAKAAVLQAEQSAQSGANGSARAAVSAGSE